MSPPDAPSRNLFASPSDVSVARRAAVARQRGCVLWFSGLSGSGKSTIARALESALIDTGRLPFVLDGDNLRLGLNRDLGFSESDRAENLRRVAEVARLMADASLLVITAFISPLRASRQAAREIIGAERFFEVHVSTSLATCEARDVKGLYRKAREGAISDFTGISSPFEPPESPALEIPTETTSVSEAVRRLTAMLERRGIFSAGAGA
jgi:adenylyl-sulfate kinase